MFLLGPLRVLFLLFLPWLAGRSAASWFKCIPTACYSWKDWTVFSPFLKLVGAFGSVWGRSGVGGWSIKQRFVLWEETVPAVLFILFPFSFSPPDFLPLCSLLAVILVEFCTCMVLCCWAISFFSLSVFDYLDLPYRFFYHLSAASQPVALFAIGIWVEHWFSFSTSHSVLNTVHSTVVQMFYTYAICTTPQFLFKLPCIWALCCRARSLIIWCCLRFLLMLSMWPGSCAGMFWLGRHGIHGCFSGVHPARRDRLTARAGSGLSKAVASWLVPPRPQIVQCHAMWSGGRSGIRWALAIPSFRCRNQLMLWVEAEISVV